MAQTEVTENWSDRRFRPGEFAQRGWIVTGVANENEAILAIGAEAQLDSQFILDGSLKADSPECIRHQGPLAYHVVTQYRADETSGGGGGSQLDTTIDWEFDEGFSSEPTDSDADGNLITDTAGFPVTGAVDEQPLAFFTATRNERRFDIALSNNFRGAINKDRVRVLGYNADPGQLRLLSYKPTHAWNDKTTSFRNVYRFELRKGRVRIRGSQIWDGFYRRILNAGYMGHYDETTTVDGREVTVAQTGRFVNSKGEEQGTITPLDGTGKPLGDTIKVRGGPGTAKTPIGVSAISDQAFIERSTDKKGNTIVYFLRYPRGPLMPFNALGIFRS